MSANHLNDISSVYMQEVFKPQLGKGGDSSSSGPKKVEKGKDDAESSAKRIRQAVYDIRYRARREDVKLDQAFSQYIGHTTMNAQEKAAVKEKLGLTAGSSSGPVKEETDLKKFKVRVKDKESGKSYVRYATREKINQLRSNPNISSVEMTGYGDPYEGERKKGKATAKVTAGKGLDPVGREDKDIDNDGDHDKSDKYLLNRRQVRGAAIDKKKDVKEAFSNWRNDLREVLDSEDSENQKQIKEKKVNNKIVVNPELKESVESLGGLLVDVTELNCILEEIADEELYFLSDDLIEEVVEEVFYELLEDGYDVDLIENIICESLDTSYEIINEVSDSYYADAVKTSKKRGDAARRAERIQKVKDTVKKVGSSIKSKIKSAGKSVVSGAAHAAGKAVASAKNAGSAVKGAAAKAGQKASETAKKVSDTAKSGYEAGKKSAGSGSSTATATKTKAPKTYRYVRQDTEKKSGLASKVGSLLKKGLKKAVGKTARVVAKGAEKVASKLGEEKDPCWKGYTMVGMKKKGGKEVPNCVPAKGVKKAEGFKEENELEEKALSRAQQRFMGMVYAAKKGETPASPEVAKAAAGISKKSARDFAKTKHTKLPEKKVEEAVTQISGKETTPPSGTTAKQDDIQKKQMLANKQKMIQKQQMLQRQELQLQRQGKLPLGTTSEEVDYEIEEGMSMKDFKANRRKLKRREASADAKKRGHVGKEWYNSGRTYSPDEAKSGRANMQDHERSTRHRSAVDPEGDDDLYSADKTKNPKKLRKQKAMGEDFVTELNRYEKETGKDYKTGKEVKSGGSTDKAYTHVKKMIRGMEGKPAGQRKKVPGKKPPTAGQYGGPASPAQKVAKRRADAKRAQDNMSSRFD
jgi:hypothetical protein